MSMFLQSWIRGLTAASLISALSQQITPPGPVKKVTEAVCGIMLIGVLLLPAAQADGTVFSHALADYRRTAAELTGDLETEEKQLLRSYIEQKCAAYILDEARAMGVTELEARVLAEWREGSWIPVRASIRGTFTETQRARLSAIMTSELGISAEDQEWNG